MTLDLRSLHAVLFDMDGVLYRGDVALAGVNALWQWLDDHGIAYACLTNNSTQTPEQFVAKLASMNLITTPDRIITSSLVTSVWLRARAPRGTTVYAIGMQGLRSVLFDDGYFVERADQPEYVVVGADFEVTYSKLRAATLAIRAGAQFIGTNPDRTFPAADGITPGAGALLAAVVAATDRTPTVMGKPERAMFDTALHLLQATPATTLMVGDRLDTDIVGAQQAGLQTALVLTGVSSAAEAAAHAPPPDAVFADLPALLAHLKDTSLL